MRTDKEFVISTISWYKRYGLTLIRHVLLIPFITYIASYPEFIKEIVYGSLIGSSVLIGFGLKDYKYHINRVSIESGKLTMTCSSPFSNRTLLKFNYPIRIKFVKQFLRRNNCKLIIQMPSKVLIFDLKVSEFLRIINALDSFDFLKANESLASGIKYSITRRSDLKSNYSNLLKYIE